MTGDVVKTTRLNKKNLKMKRVCGAVRCVRSTDPRNSDEDGRAGFSQNRQVLGPLGH